MTGGDADDNNTQDGWNSEGARDAWAAAWDGRLYMHRYPKQQNPHEMLDPQYIADLPLHRRPKLLHRLSPCAPTPLIHLYLGSPSTDQLAGNTQLFFVYEYVHIDQAASFLTQLNTLAQSGSGILPFLSEAYLFEFSRLKQILNWEETIDLRPKDKGSITSVAYGKKQQI
ncbi:hypothetical protein L6452_34527 [Arctium lappa]|uniref:Uncharacterized protein n=1 Tax=Arctium lappa TaxID=4217 RepID=A0ACB8YJL1_ARCLA|nr:hypothetical protein L6452_34527 [Arctium lappa]